MHDLSLQTFNQLSLMLQELYGFSGIDKFRPVSGGFVTKNFRFAVEDKHYFLKRYETENTHRINDINTAFFRLAQGGVPVIMPKPTMEGQLAFLLEEAWWSIFPFVEGRLLMAEQLTISSANELGSTLGLLHRIGLDCKRDDISTLTLWNSNDFLSDQIALEYTYRHLDQKRDVDTLAIQNIRLQSAFIQSHTIPTDRFQSPNDCLIHGDFTHNNVFFDEAGRVKWIYDLDKACVAPRAYEVARSVLITCFDHGWDEKSFALANAFLRAYLNVCPMSFDEFDRGFRLYVTHFMHMTWLEKKVLLSRSQRHESFIFTSHRRLEHLIEDFNTLAGRLYPAA